MPRVHEMDHQAARFEDFVDRNPEDAGRFQRHARDAACHEPIGEALQVRGEGAKRLHRLVVTIRRHRDHMRGGPAVNAGRIRIHALEHRRRRPSGTPRTTRAGLRPSDTSSGEKHPGTGSTRTTRLPNGITTEVVSPTIRTSLPGPRDSTGTTPAPVSRRPRRPDAVPSYVRRSSSAGIAPRFSADEPWQRHMDRYSRVIFGCAPANACVDGARLMRK